MLIIHKDYDQMNENVQNGTICSQTASYINEDYLCVFPNFGENYSTFSNTCLSSYSKSATNLSSLSTQRLSC